MEFYLYKGLKKPLVFFGLKGKYLYIGGIIVSGGFLSIAILSNVLGWIGLLISMAITGASVWYLFYIQEKKGIYNKTKNHNEIHIIPNKMKNKKIMIK